MYGKSDHIPKVVLRFNDSSQRNSCALCDCDNRMSAPLAASLYGAEQYICLDCFEKDSGLKGVARLIDHLNCLLLTVPDERHESFLCGIDFAAARAGKDIELPF